MSKDKETGSGTRKITPDKTGAGKHKVEDDKTSGSTKNDKGTDKDRSQG